MLSLVCSLLAVTVLGDIDWDFVETTFEINPWGIIPDKGYFNVPLTAYDALQANSEKKSKTSWDLLFGCNDAGAPGNVWIDGDDLSTMPVYNSYGNLAGIILGMPDPGKTAQKPPFIQFNLPNGTKFWGIQVMYRDPTYTCDKTVAEDVYTSGPVGDTFIIINGNEDGSDYTAPLMEDGELAADGWKRGACFAVMGVHYWRYMTPDMDCDDTYPIFLLYDKKSTKLVAWGIAMAHSDSPYLTSKKWEHPGGSVLKAFFQNGQMPECLPKMGALTTQHVYNTQAKNIWC